MNESEINKLLGKLDGRGTDAEYDAIKSLSRIGEALPGILLQKYRASSKYGERASCVHHAIKYAKNNNEAFQLGLEALKDKSKKVRYRACMLLAISHNTAAIPDLEALLSDKDSKEDAKAAIDAIKNKNHNYFLDRDHSGKVTLNVCN